MSGDAREPVRSYQVPDPLNEVAEDFARLILAITSIGEDIGDLLTSVAGRALLSHTHAISDISGLEAALLDKMDADATFALDTLTDVNSSGATDLQVLTWNDGASQWIPAAVNVDNVAGMTTFGRNLAKTASLKTARVDSGMVARTNRGNANYTILMTDRVVGIDTAFTAPRTFTLPLANTVNAGDVIAIVDEIGGLTSTNKLLVARAGTDTVNGGSTSVEATNAFAVVFAMSDGTSRWTVKVLSGAGLTASLNLSDVASIATSRVNLNIESYTGVNDANAVLASEKHNYVWTALTATRTATLRAASAYNPGQVIYLTDGSNSASPSKKITALINGTPGTDTIIGAFEISSPGGRLLLFSDGVSKFYGIETATFGTSAGQAVRLDSNGNVPGLTHVPKPQTVLTGPKSGNTPSLFPATNPGNLALTVQNVDSTHPVVFTIGKGYDALGRKDYVGQITTNAWAWTGLKASVRNYLRVSDAGVVDSNWIRPQYTLGGLPDYRPVALHHFDGGADAYGNTWSMINGASLDTAAPKFGASNLKTVSASSQYAQLLTGPDLSEFDQWTVECWFKRASLSSNQDIIGYGPGSFGFIVRFAATNVCALYLSSNGTSYNIANATLGAVAHNDTTTWHHLALVFDGATYKVYVDGAQEISVSSSAKLTASNEWNVGANTIPNTFYNGGVDEFRISNFARYTAAFTPSASAFTADDTWDVFDITGNQMYVWPAQTAVNRVYIGEALCDITGVADAFAYAYQRRYSYTDSGSLPTAGTAVSKTSGLGIDNGVIRRLSLINMSAELGYGYLDDIDNPLTASSTDWAPFNVWAGPTTIGFTVGGTTAWALHHKTTGVTTALTAAKWVYRLEAWTNW